MTNHESIPHQAEALAHLFEEADVVLRKYVRTKDSIDLDQFDAIGLQISNNWKRLKETFEKLDDKKVKESFEKLGYPDIDKFTCLVEHKCIFRLRWPHLACPI